MAENITPHPDFLTLLDQALAVQASDIHILAGSLPMIRVGGLLRAAGTERYTRERANEIVSSFIGESLQKQIATDRRELDFAFTYKELRFRVNVFLERSTLSASLRLLPKEVPTLASLGVPPVLTGMLKQNQGLVIICGPTGHGKSTTLAACLNQIASERQCHIITIEDPIEYVFTSDKSIITQREVGTDTPSFASALRAALREDPDVVLLGEMRDMETVEAAMQVAETGHLVLTTLHTNSSAQTTNRIIDMFPKYQQDQIKVQLAEILLGVLSQRLLPRPQGGVVLATEVLVVNAAVRTMIREGKTHQLPNLIQTSSGEGMVGLDRSLADLVNRGEVPINEALAWSLDPKTLKSMIY